MGATAETYVATCLGCRAGFNALAASWCACLVPETTLVCPSCQRCFCAAPPAYKSKFWSGAPRRHGRETRHEAHKVYKVDDYLTKPLAFGELRPSCSATSRARPSPLWEVRE